MVLHAGMESTRRHSFNTIVIFFGKIFIMALLEITYECLRQAEILEKRG